MGGTSERKPPEQDREHRHLRAVPPLDPEPGTAEAPKAELATGRSGTDNAVESRPDSTAGPETAPGPDTTGPDTTGPDTTGPDVTAAAPPATGPGAPATLWTAPPNRILAAVGFYAVLLVFGVLQGLTGAFQFSRGLGPVPLAAVFFALAIGATCWLCGRAMRSVMAALVPALGWIVAAYTMAMPNTSGSVVITNSIAGEIYLYGGALCAAIGVGAAFGGWTRAQQAGLTSASTGPRRPRP